MTRVMKNSYIEWIGKIPENWDCVPLRFITEQINEKNDPIKFSNILSLTNTKGVVPYEEKGNQGNISKEDLTQYKIAYKNTVIINSMNLKIGSVGLSNYEGCISPVYYVLKNKKNSDIRYINYLFQSSYQKWLGKFGKGILEIREKIGMYDVLHSYVPAPSFQEQQKIADYLDKKCSKIDEQKDNYENSIELLKEYKQSLITKATTRGLNNKIELKDSGIDYIGNIPNHRYINKLKYLGNFQNGISKSGESFKSGYPFLSYGDVYKNFVIPEQLNGLVESNESERENYSVKYGDIFITRTSETIEEIGLTAVCLKTIDNATFSGFIIRFRPDNTNKLNPEFSKYYFRSDIHRKYFVKEMNLVTRASLGQNLLGNLPVLLPPLEEQKQIADFLDKECLKIDKVIAYREQMIEKLEEYKKSLIYECVTGKKEIK